MIEYCCHLSNQIVLLGKKKGISLQVFLMAAVSLLHLDLSLMAMCILSIGFQNQGLWRAVSRICWNFRESHRSISIKIEVFLLLVLYSACSSELWRTFKDFIKINDRFLERHTLDFFNTFWSHLRPQVLRQNSLTSWLNRGKDFVIFWRSNVYSRVKLRHAAFHLKLTMKFVQKWSIDSLRMFLT